MVHLLMLNAQLTLILRSKKEIVVFCRCVISFAEECDMCVYTNDMCVYMSIQCMHVYVLIVCFAAMKWKTTIYINNAR